MLTLRRRGHLHQSGARLRAFTLETYTPEIFGTVERASISYVQ
jgi:hypothetical protein